MSASTPLKFARGLGLSLQLKGSLILKNFLVHGDRLGPRQRRSLPNA